MPEVAVQVHSFPELTEKLPVDEFGPAIWLIFESLYVQDTGFGGGGGGSWADT